MLTSIPFARPQDSGPSVAIVTKVNRIQDQLVKKHDVELHMHLNRLEIAPQIYGMSVLPLTFFFPRAIRAVPTQSSSSVVVLFQPLGAFAVRSWIPASGPAGGLGRSICRQHHPGPCGLRLCGHAALHPRRSYVTLKSSQSEHVFCFFLLAYPCCLKKNVFLASVL